MRRVKVCSVSFPGVEEESSLFKKLETYLETAFLSSPPDIVCLPEIFPYPLFQDFKKCVREAKEIPNFITDYLSEKAKENHCYIISPLLEKTKEGKIYNSAVLLDRKGEIAGVYRKNYPTIEELEAGISPGKKPVIIETDFGKVGVIICFDLNFRGIFEEIKKEGAKLVFFPTRFPGGKIARFRCLEFSIFMVSAFSGEGSMIIDPLGDVLEVSTLHEPVIEKEINLDFEVFHLDYNKEKIPTIKEKYGDKVQIKIASSEGIFLLSSWLKKISVSDLIKEFGLRRLEVYFAQSLQKRNSSLF